MKTPSYEYELLHQFEVIFRDGEHKTQAATRDYSKVWENIIDNPPEEGVTPIHVYRLNGTTCAVIAGMDELVENEECAMEIARLSARLAEDAKVRAGLVEALQDLLAYAESQICSHEETHRGGAIWEICDICGDCWADDDGGKPPRQDPEEIVATRSALLAAAKEMK